MKSAAEIDKGFDQDKQFMANMGEDGMKKFSELLAASHRVQPAQSVRLQLRP